MSYNGQVASLLSRKYPHDLKLNILYGGSFVKSLMYEKALLIQIGIKRKVMYRKAKMLGFTHPLVVACSQELDQLLNRYQGKAS